MLYEEAERIALSYLAQRLAIRTDGFSYFVPFRHQQLGLLYLLGHRAHLRLRILMTLETSLYIH